jgi:dynein heavy chain
VNYLEDNHYHHSDEDKFLKQVDKVMQLYEVMLTRHTTMIVGPTGGGKSLVLECLKSALGAVEGCKVVAHTINSKSITVDELYGVLEPATREWTDGLLSKIFRQMN